MSKKRKKANNVGDEKFKIEGFIDPSKESIVHVYLKVDLFNDRFFVRKIDIGMKFDSFSKNQGQNEICLQLLTKAIEILNYHSIKNEINLPYHPIKGISLCSKEYYEMYSKPIIY